MIRKKSLVVLALAAALVGAAGRPASAIFDKARFATDLGVAFFAFHHWVYGPYKAGAFASGAPGLRNPITGMRGCCAFAANVEAAAPPSPAMKCRRPMVTVI